MPSPLRSSLPAVAVLLAALLAGCGGESSGAGSGSPGTTQASPSETASPKPKPKPKPTKSGTPKAGATISEGARRATTTGYALVGVRRGTKLSVYQSPAEDAPVVRRLRPMAQKLEPVGAPKTVGDAVWQQVRAGRVTGWVDSSKLAQFGKATPHPELVQAPIGETRVALARNAARHLGMTGPLVIVKVKHPVVVLDHFEEGDDSVRGRRLRVVVMFGEAGFQVQEAASRPICARGASKGMCL